MGGFIFYRAGFARVQKLIAGGSVPAPWVTFFCSAKRNGRKKRPPEWRAYPALRASGLRSPDRTSLSWRATSAIPHAVFQALGPRLAMLGRAIRGLNNSSFDLA